MPWPYDKSVSTLGLHCALGGTASPSSYSSERFRMNDFSVSWAHQLHTWHACWSPGEFWAFWEAGRWPRRPLPTSSSSPSCPHSDRGEASRRNWHRTSLPLCPRHCLSLNKPQALSRPRGDQTSPPAAQLSDHTFILYLQTICRWLDHWYFRTPIICIVDVSLWVSFFF